jgi:ribonuclease HI
MRTPTKQRAEIVAATEALLKLWKLYSLIEREMNSVVIIKTDSDYLIKVITEWILEWKKNDWKNLQGHPVKNQVYI